MPACARPRSLCFFFFNDTATTEIYTLSLHDAFRSVSAIDVDGDGTDDIIWQNGRTGDIGDRKSTRLNSSHDQISYAVFCSKKKKGARACGARRTKTAGRLTTTDDGQWR